MMTMLSGFLTQNHMAYDAKSSNASEPQTEGRSINPVYVIMNRHTIIRIISELRTLLLKKAYIRGCLVIFFISGLFKNHIILIRHRSLEILKI